MDTDVFWPCLAWLWVVRPLLMHFYWNPAPTQTTERCFERQPATPKGKTVKAVGALPGVVLARLMVKLAMRNIIRALHGLRCTR